MKLDRYGVLERPVLTPPDADTHKYQRGHAMVWSGPPLHTGASRLTAQAALAIGAGLVTIIGERTALLVHAAHVTAIMLREAEADLSVIDDRVTALAIGPGAGSEVGDTVCHLLDQRLPIVLDADALTAFAGQSGSLFSHLHAGAVMTPHEGEFARLFPEISLDDRKAAVALAARQSGAVMLLKGRETMIAAPDERTAINTHASPWLATAGSGDVLTGMICGLLAQGHDPFEAAAIAGWLHGDIGVRYGPGLTADAMAGQIPLVLQGCLAES